MICIARTFGAPETVPAGKVARINGIGTVNVTRAYLKLAGEGDVIVNVASTAGHSLPQILIPFRAFPLAETDPAKFERVIVRRARILGKKLHSGLAYSMSKAFVIWYARRQAAAFGERGARIVSVSPGSFDTPMGRLEAAPNECCPATPAPRRPPTLPTAAWSSSPPTSTPSRRPVRGST